MNGFFDLQEGDGFLGSFCFFAQDGLLIFSRRVASAMLGSGRCPGV